jgi:hypothetical protein
MYFCGIFVRVNAELLDAAQIGAALCLVKNTAFAHIL